MCNAINVVNISTKYVNVYLDAYYFSTNFFLPSTGVAWHGVVFSRVFLIILEFMIDSQMCSLFSDEASIRKDLLTG